MTYRKSVQVPDVTKGMDLSKLKPRPSGEQGNAKTPSGGNAAGQGNADADKQTTSSGRK